MKTLQCEWGGYLLWGWSGRWEKIHGNWLSVDQNNGGIKSLETASSDLFFLNSLKFCHVTFSFHQNHSGIFLDAGSCRLSCSPCWRISLILSSLFEEAVLQEMFQYDEGSLVIPCRGEKRCSTTCLCRLRWRSFSGVWKHNTNTMVSHSCIEETLQ